MASIGENRDAFFQGTATHSAKSILNDDSRLILVVKSSQMSEKVSSGYIFDLRLVATKNPQP